MVEKYSGHRKNCFTNTYILFHQKDIYQKIYEQSPQKISKSFQMSSTSGVTWECNKFSPK
jgi:hypothetical protein